VLSVIRFIAVYSLDNVPQCSLDINNFDSCTCNIYIAGSIFQRWYWYSQRETTDHPNKVQKVMGGLINLINAHYDVL